MSDWRVVARVLSEEDPARAGLLAGISVRLQGQLPKKEAAYDQFLADLQRLELWRNQVDRSDPLLAYLLAAADALEDAVRKATLEQAIAHARETAPSGRGTTTNDANLTPSATRERQLYAFLKDAFTTDELRRLLRYLPHGEELVQALVDTAPLATFADSAVAGLRARGLVDAQFFDRLREERPKRADEIAAIARAWGV